MKLAPRAPISTLVCYQHAHFAWGEGGGAMRPPHRRALRVQRDRVQASVYSEAFEAEQVCIKRQFVIFVRCKPASLVFVMVLVRERTVVLFLNVFVFPILSTETRTLRFCLHFSLCSIKIEIDDRRGRTRETGSQPRSHRAGELSVVRNSWSSTWWPAQGRGRKCFCRKQARLSVHENRFCRRTIFREVLVAAPSDHGARYILFLE